MPRALLEPHDNRVFAALNRCAEAGLPCPSNSEICDLAGMLSSSSGTRAVSRLQKLGLIRVFRGQCKRVVLIVATGKRTAGEILSPHWRDRKDHVRHVRPKPVAKVIAPPEPKPQRPRIDRDPCPWCGTRRDIGCSHIPAAAA